MDIVIDGSVVRTLSRVATCAAKIGHEIHFVAHPADGLTLRSLNSSRSAFFSTTFGPNVFDNFRVSAGTVQVAILTKAFLAALRTSKIHRIVLRLPRPDSNVLTFQIESEASGLTKEYRVAVIQDAEFLVASIDPRLIPHRFVVRPDVLARLLSNFQQTQHDITIICKPEFARHPAAQAGRGARETKNLSFTSFRDPAKAQQQAEGLQTWLDLDTREGDLDLHFRGARPLHLTVNLRDLRAMVGFCADMSLDVSVAMDSPGRPLVVTPSFRNASMRMDCSLAAQLVLATMTDEGSPGGGAPQQPEASWGSPSPAAHPEGARGEPEGRQLPTGSRGPGGGSREHSSELPELSSAPEGSQAAAPPPEPRRLSRLQRAGEVGAWRINQEPRVHPSNESCATLTPSPRSARPGGEADAHSRGGASASVAGGAPPLEEPEALSWQNESVRMNPGGRRRRQRFVRGWQSDSEGEEEMADAPAPDPSRAECGAGPPGSDRGSQPSGPAAPPDGPGAGANRPDGGGGADARCGGRADPPGPSGTPHALQRLASTGVSDSHGGDEAPMGGASEGGRGGWEEQTSSDEDDGEQILATPPEKRTRYEP